MKNIPLAILSLAIFLALTVPLQAAEEIAIIANPKYPKSQISMSDLKKIYSGEKEYQKNIKIVPLDQSDIRPVKIEFVRRVFDVPLKKYKGHWLIRAFREGTIMPAVMEDSDEVIDAVERDPGAIGYVWASDVKENHRVKVVLSLAAQD